MPAETETDLIQVSVGRSYILEVASRHLVCVLRSKHTVGGILLVLALALILVNLTPAQGAFALLVVTRVDAGSGSVNPNCPAPGCSEGPGASFTVTAVPSSGWQFSSWSTQTGVSCVGGASSNPCTVTLPLSQVSIVIGATFTQIMQTLITGVDAGSGSVNPNCPSPAGCSEAVGSSITVTATPSSGWQFSTWSTQMGISCSTNPCTFSMPNNAVTLKATFTPIPIPEYPLGLPLLAIFMVLAYAVIKRRTRNPKDI
jgi:hypothetical protein